MEGGGGRRAEVGGDHIPWNKDHRAAKAGHMRMKSLTRAEFIARAVADMAAEKERKRRAIWRGRWEAAIVKGEHIEQMRRKKR